MLIATFNMKNPYSPALSKNWIKRADAAIELIRKRSLNVIGTQELTPRTKDYLENKLMTYIKKVENSYLIYFLGYVR